MAELQLSDEQHRQLSDLLGQIARDGTLRARLEADPRSVLAEFGLAGLVPEGYGVEQLHAIVGQSDVTGYLMHADSHDDSHGDYHYDAHHDAHWDQNVGRTGGGLPGISIGPSLLPS